MSSAVSSWPSRTRACSTSRSSSSWVVTPSYAATTACAALSASPAVAPAAVGFHAEATHRGVRRTALGESGDFIGVVNNSLFYSHTEKFSVGVELNSEINGRRWRYRLTPQLQFSFGKNAIFQFGGGPSQLDRERTDWLITSRLVYSF